MYNSTWPDLSGRVNPEEFSNPSQMDHLLVAALARIRLTLDAPMWFTLKGGAPRHPNGDAVDPTATSHSDFSLHKYGIDHVASKRTWGLILLTDKKSLAVDFDTDAATDAFSLWQISQVLEKIELPFPPFRLGGIGLYPDWNVPGFHIDLRPQNHQSFGARWFRLEGEYHRLGRVNYFAMTGIK